MDRMQKDVDDLISDLMALTYQLKARRSIDLETALEMCKVVDKYGGNKQHAGRESFKYQVQIEISVASVLD